MSIFKKALASIGIGSTKIDTVLEKDSYQPGETLTGKIQITGGNVEQEINDIYLKVNTQILKEQGDSRHYVSYVLVKYRVSESRIVGPNESFEIPFSIQIPYTVPITLGSTQVWIQTELDISNAIDPKDRDYVKIQPANIPNEIFNTLLNLGFRLREADCKASPYRLSNDLPFVQEFEFVPTSGEFRGKLDEIEVVILEQTEMYTKILVQVDRRGGFFSESFSMDETHVTLTVRNEDIPTLSQQLYQLIRKHS